MRACSASPSSKAITAVAALCRIVCPEMNTCTFDDRGAGAEFLGGGPAIAIDVRKGTTRRASQPSEVEQQPPALVGATQSVRFPKPGTEAASATRAFAGSDALSVPREAGAWFLK